MTIQRRLWLGLVVGLTVLVGAAGLLLYRVTESSLERGMDVALDARLASLAADLELSLSPDHEHAFSRLGADVLRHLDDDGPEARAERERLRTLADDALVVRLGYTPVGKGETAGRMPFEVLAPDGTTLLRSRAGGADSASLRVRTRVVEDVPLRNPRWSRSWRQIRDRVGIAPRRVILRAMQDRSAADAVLAGLARWLVLGCLAVLVAGTLLVLVTVRRGLAPLRGLARAVDRLGGPIPLRSIHLDDEPEDLRPVVSALNAGLDRLATSLERERRISAHMAHELRTPVAELTSITDVATRWPEDDALRAQCVEQCADIARHMQRMVATLLRMARPGEPGDAARRRELLLEPLLASSLAAAHEPAARRGVTIETRVVPGTRVATDPDVLQTMLENLLGNAAHHAPAGSRVEVTAGPAGDRTRVVVGNLAPDVAPEDLPHLTDPFWRAGAYDAEDADHVGLGLALVEELSRTAGIAFGIDLRDGVLEMRLDMARDLATLQ